MHVNETPAYVSLLGVVLMLNSVGKRKLRPLSYVALSIAALVRVFDFEVPLSLFPTYIVVCFAVEMIAIAIAFVDCYWFDRWRDAKRS